MNRMLLLSIALTLCGCSGNGRSSLSDRSAAAPETVSDTLPAAAEKTDRLQIEPQTLDIGTLPVGESRKNRVEVRNTSEKPMVIYRITSSCGCTKASWSKRPVAPDGRTTIEVTYTADEAGVVEKKMMLWTNLADEPAVLAVKGLVTAESGL